MQFYHNYKVTLMSKTSFVFQKTRSNSVNRFQSLMSECRNNGAGGPGDVSTLSALKSNQNYIRKHTKCKCHMHLRYMSVRHEKSC